MGTHVWILMFASPFVEVLRQMHSETAAFWKVGLADEYDWYIWRITALAGFKESHKISEVLRHDETVLDHGEFEYFVISGAVQLHVVD
jgi:hypothetical protein